MELSEENDRLKSVRHPDGCDGCYEKQLKIDRLEEKVLGLEAKLRTEERKCREGYFGSSTPSSQRPTKPDSACENPKKNGGAPKGHRGHGRKRVAAKEADEVVNLDAADRCPDCDGELVSKGVVERSVKERVRVETKKIVYRTEKKWCAKCRKTIQRKAPVLPRSLYGNRFLAQAVIQHEYHGIPAGRVEAMLDPADLKGGLFGILHRLADLFKPAIPKLVEEFRREPVRHGDETGWRTDGQSGYAWIFCSPRTSLFQFEDTRSSRIPLAVLGSRRLPGVLVVDRYKGYNRVPCGIQYCYAHLLRKVEDLGKQFPDEPEVQAFVGVFATLLARAIHLRTMPISNRVYYQKARILKKRILKAVRAPSHHLGIREIQTIFMENSNRLYHWVKDRNIPADNNRAERELRPTVIARKVSFGSQSERGAQSRSILMTVLHTAQKRLKNKSLEDWFKETLDQIAANPKIDPYSLIPP